MATFETKGFCHAIRSFRRLQIGKVFKQFAAKEESLRQARLGAIERLAELAVANGASHVLVAGDVYDSDAPSPITLRAPIERMKPFADVHWHLLPGNHDPHRPEGVWDRLLQAGLPPNVHLHLTPAAFALDQHTFLLPAPLTRKAESSDVTAWMDSATTPAGALRIGLAHGSVTNFGSEGEATNPIDPARPKNARLDYLALGDWHRTLQIGPAVWYARHARTRPRWRPGARHGAAGRHPRRRRSRVSHADRHRHPSLDHALGARWRQRRAR
jgi:hypothetical protein